MTKDKDEPNADNPALQRMLERDDFAAAEEHRKKMVELYGEEKVAEQMALLSTSGWAAPMDDDIDLDDDPHGHLASDVAEYLAKRAEAGATAKVPLPPISAKERSKEDVKEALTDAIIGMLNKERKRRGLQPIGGGPVGDDEGGDEG